MMMAELQCNVVQQSRDQGRAAIALFTARHHNPAKSSHQVTLQGLVFQLDTALARYSIYL